MTTITGPAPRRPSRLLELIRNNEARPGAGRVGFLARDAAPVKRAVLIASLPRADSAAADAAARAGADAIELPVSRASDLDIVRAIVSAVSVPVGAHLSRGADAGLVAAAAEHGLDWIRLPFTVSIAALEWEKPARLLTLPADLELRLLASMAGLQVDGVVAAADEGTDLTIATGLRLRAIGDLAKKPLLLQLDAGIAPAVAAATDHLGVDGLLVEVDGAAGAERIASLVGALRQPSSAR